MGLLNWSRQTQFSRLLEDGKYITLWARTGTLCTIEAATTRNITRVRFCRIDLDPFLLHAHGDGFLDLLLQRCARGGVHSGESDIPSRQKASSAVNSHPLSAVSPVSCSGRRKLTRFVL